MPLCIQALGTAEWVGRWRVGVINDQAHVDARATLGLLTLFLVTEPFGRREGDGEHRHWRTGKPQEGSLLRDAAVSNISSLSNWLLTFLSKFLTDQTLTPSALTWKHSSNILASTLCHCFQLLHFLLFIFLFQKKAAQVPWLNVGLFLFNSNKFLLFPFIALSTATHFTL
jgi:hypothetical protein